MKKIFKVVLFIFVVGSIILFNSKSYASTLNEKEKTFFNENEIVEELEGTNKVDILKKAKSLLLLLNIKNTGNEEKVYKITDKENLSGEREYYKVLYNGDSYISFSKDGELIEADTFFYKVPKSDVRFRSLDSQSNIDILSENIKNKGYILKEKDDNYFNGNTLYRFEKTIHGDLTNRFDNYTIVYDEQNENIVSFMKVSNPVEYKEPTVSLEEARKTAINYSQTNNIKSSELGVYKDDNGNAKLGYIVNFENGNIIVVSPYENKIVQESFIKGYFKGKAFAYNKFAHYKQSLDLAYDGMEKLGYSMLPNYTLVSDIENPIKNAVNTDGFRALYVDSHGSTTTLETYGNNVLYASDLRNNYPNLKLRFVFLDACKTGVNSYWSDTFKINSSWGAFVGWNGKVDETQAYEFSKEFWSEADGRKPILKAVDIAYRRSLPATKPTFYGNSTFYGTAN
ncbi:hypothetical protein [Peptostreptococcus porci]|uniref:hypothetical protein n=1 Tax=Peptostreptococcus porci TaxID=2652282 RepID=UPI002A82248A|nr:hypothetical protein [Peptostreptococcus porci]MDY4128463.1 hypothetical protein [Peptostreptococcus porci]